MKRKQKKKKKNEAHLAPREEWGGGRGGGREKQAREVSSLREVALTRLVRIERDRKGAQKGASEGEGKRRAPFSVVQRGCWIKRRGTLPLKAKGVTTAKKRRRKKKKKEKRKNQRKEEEEDTETRTTPTISQSPRARLIRVREAD